MVSDEAGLPQDTDRSGEWTKAFGGLKRWLRKKKVVLRVSSLAKPFGVSNDTRGW